MKHPATDGKYHRNKNKIALGPLEYHNASEICILQTQADTGDVKTSNDDTFISS